MSANEVLAGTRVAIDIGSTVVKVARIGAEGDLLEQEFHPRDFEAGIAKQVEDILRGLDRTCDDDGILVCSSANGGLRVGIVCLSKHFSGAALRNQVLMAGANPIFVHDLDEAVGDLRSVDILLVGGGIDCDDAGPLAERLERFDPDGYRFGSLLYAGNRHLAGRFVERFPGAVVVPNPLADELRSKTGSVFEAVRRAYLDDLVFKEGVSELKGSLSRYIRPTPEVVSAGFRRAVFHRSRVEVAGPCILIDIGGATTDFHYTVEIIRDDSEVRPAPGSSIARYVFTDVGIVASRDSTLMRLRGHPRGYELLAAVLGAEADTVYRSMKEDDFEPTPELLSYAALFLSLDRFSQGNGPGLPTADLSKVSQFILTGGAALGLDTDAIARVVGLFLSGNNGAPGILVDRKYQIWIDGITLSPSEPSGKTA